MIDNKKLTTLLRTEGKNAVTLVTLEQDGNIHSKWCTLSQAITIMLTSKAAKDGKRFALQEHEE